MKLCILCFGGQDWWYHNRSHADLQLMRKCAATMPVLYVNSIVMQKPNIGQGKKFLQKLVRKSKSIFKGLTKVDSNFWVYTPAVLPFFHTNIGRKFNEWILKIQLKFILRKLKFHNPLVWVVCPTAFNVAKSFSKQKLIYLRTDVYERFPNVDYDTIKKLDEKLKADSDLTLFVSGKLFNDEKTQCKKAFFIDHGVDYELFANAENITSKNGELNNIPKPIIGYFGSISEHTVDYDLIDRLTDLLKEMSFVFIGRVYSDAPYFANKKNVWLLGHKPYEEIPHYGKHFDVAIMPWRQTEWIKACNPVKLKEYLALGKPIVSTPFDELQKYLDVVYVARDAENFANSIKQALTENDPELVNARRNKIRAFTWQAKTQKILDILFENNANTTR